MWQKSQSMAPLPATWRVLKLSRKNIRMKDISYGHLIGIGFFQRAGPFVRRSRMTSKRWTEIVADINLQTIRHESSNTQEQSLSIIRSFLFLLLITYHMVWYVFYKEHREEYR